MTLQIFNDILTPINQSYLLRLSCPVRGVMIMCLSNVIPSPNKSRLGATPVAKCTVALTIRCTNGRTIDHCCSNRRSNTIARRSPNFAILLWNTRLSRLKSRFQNRSCTSLILCTMLFSPVPLKREIRRSIERYVVRHDARPQAERLEELASLLFQVLIHVKAINQISTRVAFYVIRKANLPSRW